MEQIDNRPQWAIDAGISAERLKNITAIENSAPEERGEHFRLSNKKGDKKIFVDRHNMGFVRKVQSLPAITRIEMMALTDKEMENYIAEQKKYALTWLIELLQKNWYWRESGDPVDWEYIEFSFIALSKDGLLKRCQSKRTPIKSVIDAAIEWFIGDRAEVYLKEE